MWHRWSHTELLHWLCITKSMAPASASWPCSLLYRLSGTLRLWAPHNIMINFCHCRNNASRVTALSPGEKITDKKYSWLRTPAKQVHYIKTALSYNFYIITEASLFSTVIYELPHGKTLFWFNECFNAKIRRLNSKNTFSDTITFRKTSERRLFTARTWPHSGKTIIPDNRAYDHEVFISYCRPSKAFRRQNDSMAGFRSLPRSDIPQL